MCVGNMCTEREACLVRSYLRWVQSHWLKNEGRALILVIAVLPPLSLPVHMLVFVCFGGVASGCQQYVRIRFFLSSVSSKLRQENDGVTTCLLNLMMSQ